MDGTTSSHSDERCNFIGIKIDKPKNVAIIQLEGTYLIRRIWLLLDGLENGS